MFSDKNTLHDQPAQSPPNHQEFSEGGHLTFETLLAIIILLIYTISAPLFETIHFHYMHESGVIMLLGTAITLVAMVYNPETNFAMKLKFDQEIFFTFILPPIIFAAGYNLRRRQFFKYILYILAFGVLGTIIAFVVVAPLTYIANSFELFTLTFEDGKTVDLSVKEILLFASVISATDTVAALTFVKEETEPKLFAILFGEGVVNDAVCIVLYRIIKVFSESNEEFTGKTPFKIAGNFLNLFFLSFIVGAAVGIGCALFLKKLKAIHLNRVQETSIIIFFAFLSYTLAEEIGLSPIISLLFTGIFMSHYAFYNLSFHAREESSIVSKIMSNIAEAFVFTYLGLTFINSLKNKFSLSFVLCEFVFVTCGRYCSIHGLSFIFTRIFKLDNFKIKASDKGIMSFAGSIRGAIAFGLAISIDTPNREILISGTLVLVFITTILFGAFMPYVFKFYKGDEMVHAQDPLLEKQLSFHFIQSNPNIGGPDEKPKEILDEEKMKKRLSYWLSTYWRQFDRFYIKPKLIHNWPQVAEDHDEIANGIINVINEFKKKRKNREENEGIELKELKSNNEQLIHH